MATTTPGNEPAAAGRARCAPIGDVPPSSATARSTCSVTMALTATTLGAVVSPAALRQDPGGGGIGAASSARAVARRFWAAALPVEIDHSRSSVVNHSSSPGPGPLFQ
jgi:hypothetical protein